MSPLSERTDVGRDAVQLVERALHAAAPTPPLDTSVPSMSKSRMRWVRGRIGTDITRTRIGQRG